MTFTEYDCGPEIPVLKRIERRVYVVKDCQGCDQVAAQESSLAHLRHGGAGGESRPEER